MSTPDDFQNLPAPQGPTREDIEARRSTPAPMAVQPDAPMVAPPQTRQITAAAFGGQGLPHEERVVREFTLPLESMGDRWASSGFTDAQRTFGLVQIKVGESIRCTRLMGQSLDFGTVQQEQVLTCIRTIGGVLVERDRDMKIAWLEAIGPGCLHTVEFCWNKINTRPEKEMSAVFESGEIKRA